MSGVQGVILAGVHQWQSSAFERWTPRVLVPIVNRPLIEYPLTWLLNGGVKRVQICANSDTHALRKRIGGGNQVQIDYYEDDMPRGPAGCVADALRNQSFEHAVVLDATVIPQALDLRSMLSTHVDSGAAVTVVTSVLNGQAASPVGVYVMNREALSSIPALGFQDIKEMFIPQLYDAGLTVRSCPVGCIVPRVHNAGSCLVASAWILGRMLAAEAPPPGIERKGDLLYHKDACIDATVRFVGPVLIGPRAVIGKGVTIVGPTTVGSDVTVGSGSLICRSIVCDHARVGVAAVLDRCIVADGSEIADSARVIGRIAEHCPRRFGRFWHRHDHRRHIRHQKSSPSLFAVRRRT